MSQTLDSKDLTSDGVVLGQEKTTKEMLQDTTSLGHDPRVIANEFILRAQEHREASGGDSGYLLSALQVGKMAVVAHELHLAALGTPLCSESVVNDPENNRFVHFPSIREALKACGKGAVMHPIRTGISVLDQILPGRVSDIPPMRAKLTAPQNAIIEALWEVQLKYNPMCYHWSEFTKLYEDTGELDNSVIAELFAKRLAA